MRATRQYFQAVAEIDYLMWHLQEMLRTEKSLSAFDRAIDQATGFDKAKLREANHMMQRIRRLQGKIMVSAG